MFIPYWLLHEPGKEHGFATVDLESAMSAEAAIAEWRREEPEMAGLVGTEIEARLITEPFVTS